MKIINELYTQRTYSILYEISGEEYRAAGSNNKVFNQHKDFGYSTKAEFIIAYNMRTVSSDEEETIDKAIKAENRRKAYHEKMKLIEIKTLAKELRYEHPELTWDERMDLASTELYDRDQNISWKFLKSLSNNKIRSIRYQKLDKRFIQFVKPLDTTYKTLAEFYRDFRIKFDWSAFELSNTEWSHCRILKGNTAIIGNHNRILSYNSFSREGFIFDAFDVLNLLFSMSLDDVLEMLNIKVIQYDTFRAEQRHYKTILNTLDVMSELPNIKRLGVMDVYKVLLEKGLDKMHSKNFVNDKSVFYYSITAIIKELGIQETKSTIVKVGAKINLLCSLGLIKKLFRNELPESLIFENGKGYDNNYFVVPELDFDSIKANATTLKAFKVGAHNISFKVISEVFSLDYAKGIFNQLKEKAKKATDAVKKVGKALYDRFVQAATCLSGHLDNSLLGYYVENFDTLEAFELHLEKEDSEEDDIPF